MLLYMMLYIHHVSYKSRLKHADVSSVVAPALT